MHAIEPNTQYRLVTMIVAVKADSDAEATDGLNEMFNMALEGQPDGSIADWRFGGPKYEVVTSSSDPAEGELFGPPESELHQ